MGRQSCRIMPVKRWGRQGVTWAGKIALKIYPPILKELAGEVRKEIFAVCGTTERPQPITCLCAALEAEGQKVICNHTGSQYAERRLWLHLWLAAGLNGHIDADYACIEADEASTKYIFPGDTSGLYGPDQSFPRSVGQIRERSISQVDILESMIRTLPQNVFDRQWETTPFPLIWQWIPETPCTF